MKTQRIDALLLRRLQMLRGEFIRCHGIVAGPMPRW